MKKSGIVLMLGISVLMALGAAALARGWLQERTAERMAEDDESAVVMVASQIPFGQTVRLEDLRLASLPPEAIPGNSFSDLDDVAGRVAAQTMYPGEIVLAERVVEHLGGSSLGAVLEDGMRAITVRVDDVAGVAGFLLPRNRVDVLATRRDRDGGNRTVRAETILRDIKVLAVDQRASPEGEDGPVVVRAVTLGVTPPQAETISKASQEGSIRLTLRNPLDRETDNGEEQMAEAEPNPEPAEEAEATAEPEVVAEPVQPWRRQVTITVIRGTQASTSVVHSYD